MLPKSSTPLMLAEKIKDSTVLASSIYLKGNISNIFHLWSSSYSLCVAQAAVGGRARKPFYCKSSREAASEIQVVFFHKFCKIFHQMQIFKGGCKRDPSCLLSQKILHKFSSNANLQGRLRARAKLSSFTNWVLRFFIKCKTSRGTAAGNKKSYFHNSQQGGKYIQKFPLAWVDSEG